MLIHPIHLIIASSILFTDIPTKKRVTVRKKQAIHIEGRRNNLNTLWRSLKVLERKMFPTHHL